MKLLNPFAVWFRPPSAEVLAQDELDDARRSLLAAQTARDYAAAMVAYHQDRINRLAEFLASGG